MISPLNIPLLKPDAGLSNLIPLEIESVEHKTASESKKVEILSRQKVHQHNRREVEITSDELQIQLKKKFTQAQAGLNDCLQPDCLNTWNQINPSDYVVCTEWSKRLTTVDEGWIAALKGHREYMEDDFVEGSFSIFKTRVSHLSLFDGHGGVKCAHFLKKNLSKYLKEAFKKRKSIEDVDVIKVLKTTFVHLGEQYRCHSQRYYLGFCSCSIDDDFFSRIFSLPSLPGSTAITALKIKNTLWIANVGDCRAVLVHHNGQVEALSQDHKPDREENIRGIIKRGGEVRPAQEDDVTRVLNLSKTKALAMSRAVGHPEYGSGINPRASIISYPLSKLSGINNFLIMASDGLWDIVSSNHVGSTVQKIIKKHQHITKDALEKVVAETLAKLAYLTCTLKNYECDNTTILAVKLN